MEKFRKMMKIVNSITGLLLILLLIGVSGCDLQENPFSSVASKDFYKNQSQAQVALNGIYERFWWGFYNGVNDLNLNDNPGGTITSYPNTDQFDDFSWTASNNTLQSDWSVGYDAINRANTLLDNLENSNIPTDVKSNIAGQAKFLRALNYFNMVKLWGGVPLYKHATTNLENINKPRNPKEEVYTFVESDLQAAIDDMSPYSQSDHDAGKATSGAARALLAKVYAQQKKWSKAAEQSKKVMDMDVFELMDDYNDVITDNRSNKEMIFSIQHKNGGNHTTKIGNTYPFSFGPPVQTTSNGQSVAFYIQGRGVVNSQADSAFFYQTPNTYRKYQTMRDTMPHYFPVGSSDLVQQKVALSGPFIIKYYSLNSSGNLKTGVALPVLRYSDILLTYAEALNEVNNGPTQAAYDAINRVRSRARGAGTSHEQPESVYSPLSGLSQSAFRDSVLAEEAREFVGEGHRREDLLRHDRFISNAQKRGINAQDYRKLYPIPAEELNRNTNLKQNTGY